MVLHTQRSLTLIYIMVMDHKQLLGIITAELRLCQEMPPHSRKHLSAISACMTSTHILARWAMKRRFEVPVFALRTPMVSRSGTCIFSHGRILKSSGVSTN